MIKALMLLTVALSINAQAGCIGEAQIIGKVAEVKKSATSCRAFLTSNTQIQLSMVCPLDESKLFNEGVEVNCQTEAGSDISGILVDNGSFIYLE